MNFKQLLFVGAVCSSLFTFNALHAEEAQVEGEEVLSAYTNASWVLPHWRKFSATDEFLSIKGWVDISTKRSFEVDPDAEYVISGMFRTPASQAHLTMLEFGFNPIDKDEKLIPQNAISFVPGTQTTLAKDAKIGDTSIDIVSRGKWVFGTIALDAKADFSDLPNKNLYDFVPPKKDFVDGKTLTLKLKKPLTKNFAKGSLVRNHINGRLWTVSRFNKVPKEWTSFSAKIKGIDINGTNKNKWWPGTERAKVFILVGSNSQLDFNDVKVVKLD